MRLIKINEEWIKNTSIPVDKFFDDDDILNREVLSVVWYGCVKPNIASVEATLTEDCRYEEIQLFEIEITNRTMLYNIAKKVVLHVKFGDS